MNSFNRCQNHAPDPIDEDARQRAQLRSKLGLEPFLACREELFIGDPAIHCELYVHSAEAPLILFIPGIGTYAELYAELLAGISEQGFNVVGVDLRGHGYSGGSRGDYRVGQVILDLQQVISCLQQRFSGPVCVYGYSIGGLLAVALAERDERIASVLCGTLLVTELAPDLVHQFGWTLTWSSALMFPQLRLPMRTFIDYDQLLAGHPAGEEINRDPRIVFDYPLATLASLFTHRTGVLRKRYEFSAAIIHGEHDEVLPLAYSRRVVEEAKHPFELIELPGEGHMVPWDNPALLINRVSDWFHRSLPSVVGVPA